MFSKKQLLCNILILFLMAFVCLSVYKLTIPKQNEASSEPLSEQIEWGNYVESYITENISPSKRRMISDMFVYYSPDKGVQVDIRVVATGGHYIPIIADEVCPLVISAISSNNPPLSLDAIYIREYSENSIDGIDSNSFIQWKTEDGKTGLLMQKDFRVLQLSIEELYKYFD